MFGSVRCCGLPCTWERKWWLVKTVLPPSCTWNQLLFSPNPFIFVLSSHYFIFCVTSNNLLLLVIILSPYIVVILYYVTLTSSLVPLSLIISSYPIKVTIFMITLYPCVFVLFHFLFSNKITHPCCYNTKHYTIPPCTLAASSEHWSRPWGCSKVPWVQTCNIQKIISTTMSHAKKKFKNRTNRYLYKHNV